MGYAIEFEHISKSYTTEEAVLRDVNLAIQQGEFVVLLGQSGCGKTTLLKLVNNLLDFDAGYLRIHGKSSATTTLRSSGVLPRMQSNK